LPEIGGLSGGMNPRKAPCSGPASGAHLGEESTRTSSSPLLMRRRPIAPTSQRIGDATRWRGADYVPKTSGLGASRPGVA